MPVRKYVFLLVLASSICLPARAHAQWILMKADADSAVNRGITHIYNLQFDSASVQFNKVKEAYPEHPVGYFMDAMVDWWKINTNKRSQAVDEQYLAKIDTVIALCDSMLERNPYDIVGLFFKGGILGYRGRYYVTRHEWIRAAADGKAALDIVLRAWEKAPGNKDILLGVGIYHYFAEALPKEYPIVKPLMLFLPPGNMAAGVAELKLAAQKARYAATEAKVVLLQIYYRFEKDYHTCLELAQDLLQAYPQNSMFHKYVARCYVQLGRTRELEAAWREILQRCIARQTGYDADLAREAMFYIGRTLVHRGEYESALKYLYKCDEFSRTLDEDPSGFMVMANLIIGNVYDMQGKRALALKQYEKVLRWDEYLDSHAKADRYIEKAYSR